MAFIPTPDWLERWAEDKTVELTLAAYEMAGSGRDVDRANRRWADAWAGVVVDAQRVDGTLELGVFNVLIRNLSTSLAMRAATLAAQAEMPLPEWVRKQSEQERVLGAVLGALDPETRDAFIKQIGQGGAGQ